MGKYHACSNRSKMKIMNTPNKSLELSPGVPTRSVAAFSMNVEAVRWSAGQLNSMLYVLGNQGREQVEAFGDN